jgi:hypothetical protein
LSCSSHKAVPRRTAAASAVVNTPTSSDGKQYRLSAQPALKLKLLPGNRQEQAESRGPGEENSKHADRHRHKHEHRQVGVRLLHAAAQCGETYFERRRQPGEWQHPDEQHKHQAAARRPVNETKRHKAQQQTGGRKDRHRQPLPEYDVQARHGIGQQGDQ